MTLSRSKKVIRVALRELVVMVAQLRGESTSSGIEI